MMPPPGSQDGHDGHDGHHLDRRIDDARGEAADVAVGSPDAAVPPLEVAAQVPSDTYYDLPVVKAAPWKWYVSGYFYAGGLAGAASTLAAAAELAGRARFARQLHAVATVGEAAGAACLIADLGRPSRFHYMMRVVRPTSPMSIGTWILSAASASGGLALLRSLRGRRGLGVTGAVSALSGAMLSTYTGVLVGNTAIPVWSAARRQLPLWFAAASAASLASLLELWPGTPRLRGYRLAAKAAELAGAASVEAAVRRAGVARPLREGRSGRLWRGARWLGAASLVAGVLGRRRLAGALGTIAAVAARFAIVEAGRASAADPRATFEPQRS
jgi:polysulfide reductase-like protein